jgi:hypothetical protein
MDEMSPKRAKRPSQVCRKGGPVLSFVTGNHHEPKNNLLHVLSVHD